MRLSAIFFTLSMLLSSSLHAHRGAPNEPDLCRISVGSSVIHFSAYTPTFSKGESFCRAIPHVGQTNLVFDYEGKALRKTSLELEITRESDNQRIFYQAPTKAKQGSINANVDFSQYGEGKYLAHITIMHNGEELDTHLDFEIGVEEDDSIPLWKIIIVILIAFPMIIFVNRKANIANKARELNS